MKRGVPLLCLCCAGLVAARGAEDAAPAAKAVNQFAAAQLRHLPAGNALASPWSVHTQLTLLTAGAHGSTRAAMQKAFFLAGDEGALHASFRALQEEILDGTREGGETLAQISTASRLFMAKDLRLQPVWEDTARLYFNAGAQPADFRNDAEAAKDAINLWAKQQTQGRISAAVPAGALNPSTLLVLVNAVYFDMPWDERFTRELTRPRPFYLNARRAKTVPLMFKQHALQHARKAGFQITALPYADGAFQLVVILPDALDGLPAVEAQITGELLSACASMRPAEVRLSLPRIAMSPPVTDLKLTLSAMGAAEMFDEAQADFSRMTQSDAHVSHVFHGTFIELDEDGAKAASATTAVMRPKNGVPREVPRQVVRADHPFLFMIQHVSSGACLFLGRVTDPLPLQPAEDAPPFPPAGPKPARKQ